MTQYIILLFQGIFLLISYASLHLLYIISFELLNKLNSYADIQQ